MLVRTPTRQLVDFRADFPRLRCVFCEGAMDVKVLVGDG